MLLSPVLHMSSEGPQPRFLPLEVGEEGLSPHGEAGRCQKVIIPKEALERLSEKNYQHLHTVSTDTLSVLYRRVPALLLPLPQSIWKPDIPSTENPFGVCLWLFP